MKKMILMSLITLLGTAQVWGTDDFDSIRGNTTESKLKERISTIETIEKLVSVSIKRKCHIETGCVLFVDEGDGNEFRVSGGAGVGPSYNDMNGGASGIVINNGVSNEQHYGISLTYIHSNNRCVRRVPEGIFRTIEMYANLIATPEYVQNVYNAAKRGEDFPVPEHVKHAFSTLATLKPSQGNCSQNNSYNR